MNRIEFIVALSIILFVAFAAGWFAFWLLHRFTRVAAADSAEIERMAQELHEAEDLRDQALAWIEAREEELKTQLAQTEAELRATMDGLRTARHENDELRGWIERQQQG
jgi:septal ring factor EnvC (AmiA/AmiB activator)